ncbi:hypothetical protein K2173_019751 [Erythroxylum novogranatense]|uniref:Uncharacterized protein n=1 Tax=Erythroxylum novogranatense TaxID=1862640 RepID=A0AAV8SM46_9ROSI|nr:hypothetical protein K2173_019751 [Erythroxylum novogranatense]
MAKKGGIFDLETHFAFYGAYHGNPVNIFIHTLFVWPIVFTSLMLLYFTPSVVDISQFGIVDHGLVLNFGFFFTLIYAVFYVLLDKKAGVLAALLCFACWVGASFLSGRLGFSQTWKVVLVAQLFCWTGQFLGHVVFERRTPALLDNFAQAFLTAPFFVLLEVLEKAFAYEPYPGFHESVKAKTQAEIKVWEAKKQKKSS